MSPSGTNPFLFSGKIAIVTGGTSGIGHAAVQAFARAGAVVCYLGRRRELGEEQAKELRGEGYRVEFFPGDVTREDDVQHFVQTVVERHGRLDFAFNNAGLESEPKPLAETGAAAFREVLDVNVTGTFLCLKHEIPAMRACGGGAIVNNAAVLGMVALPHLAAYVASKHAVIGLTKVAALEQAQYGIRINSVCPGGTDTDMLWRTLADSRDGFDRISHMHPMGRVARPAEIADAVLWLCSEASSFVTGQAIPVDGGYNAQ
jgi:NAD(P)-dependent dehydrogenase (short-subunit alcohol dehydrogenase family)